MSDVAFKKDEIIFLLGAGASVDAKIPDSTSMIQELEKLLTTNQNWQKYYSLYCYLKSAINYADGIKGKFNNSGFNIERLVSTIDDLRRGDEHPLFPFIGSWNPKLSQITGNDFGLLSEFRREIVQHLRIDWVQLNYDADAEYYSRLCDFQKEYQHPLKVFTLNYDLCVEKGCSISGVERGFDDEKYWNWRIFDDAIDSTKNIYLYKLHGSIDWERSQEDGKLTYRDSATSIAQENLEIIFGTTYKLQYIDPFLFFAYEFRKQTLCDAKLIVTVGYGFADEHINGILKQALKGQMARKLLVVSPSLTMEEVARKLEISEDSPIICWKTTAKEFFKNKLTLADLGALFPEELSPFEESVSSLQDNIIPMKTDIAVV